MKIQITDHHTSKECLWCEKTKEGVTAHFDDGFIGKALLCWACLQKAIRVRSRNESDKQNAETSGQL